MVLGRERPLGKWGAVNVLTDLEKDPVTGEYLQNNESKATNFESE